MKISFEATSQLVDVLPRPVPAVKALPDYFKKIKPQSDEGNPQTSTVKRCIPFLEAMSNGFIIPLWSDVQIIAKDGDLNINFPASFPLSSSIEGHSYDQIRNHPLSNTPYGKMPIKWMNPWIIKTEPGVSCLFTSPLNHMETRFKVLDGVVDTDTYHDCVNFPFLWTGGDGNFVIPRGTPLMQVIPFRREKFEMTVNGTNMDEALKVRAILGTKLNSGYKDEFWHKNKDRKNSADEPLVLHNPIMENTDQQEIKDSSRSAGWQEHKSSDILEFVADDKDRGFGEGGF